MRDTGAIEDQPVLPRHARLVADGQRDQHRPVAGPLQHLPHAGADAMAQRFYAHGRRRPGLVGDLARIAAHRAFGPYARGEAAQFHVRRVGIGRAIRTAQDQGHAPEAAGQDFGQRVGGSGTRMPGDADALRDALGPVLVRFGQEAPAAAVVLRQRQHAHLQAGDLIMMDIGQGIGQTQAALQTGVEGTGRQPRQQQAGHAYRLRARRRSQS